MASAIIALGLGVACSFRLVVGLNVLRKVQGRMKRGICGAGILAGWRKRGNNFQVFRMQQKKIQNEQEIYKKWKQSDAEPMSQVSIV